MATLDIPSVEELNIDTIEEIENTISDLEAVHDVITEVYELHDNAMIS